MRDQTETEKKQTRPLWLRLLDGVRALAWPWRPRLSPTAAACDYEREKETRQGRKHLLVVVRNETSLDRVLEVLHAIGEDIVLAVKFVIDVGSKFAGEIAAQLRRLGCDVISWEEAKRQRWDAIYAAHVNNHLAELNGPLMVMAHGVSYNRILPETTGGDISHPVGLSRHELTSDGKVFPTFVGLGAPEQLSRMFQGARDRAVLVGDPVYDKLMAGRRLRRKSRTALGVGSRQFVLVSSTWGDFSTFRARRAMIKALLAVLPSDEYVVGLVAHPNIWAEESLFELRNGLVNELDSGLLLIDSTTWQAALIAADLVIGDHGSVTNYAVGLDLPVLVASNGEKELHPDSPVTWLHTKLPRLGHSECLRTAVERALAKHDPTRWQDLVREIFGLPGKGLEATVNALRALLNEPPLATLPRTRQMRMPRVHRGQPVTAYRVNVRPDGHLERHPAIVTEPADTGQSVLVVLDEEVCPIMRDNAEIIVQIGQLTEREAEEWIQETLAKHPGVGLVAAAIEGGGCVLVFGDRSRVTTARGDPFVAAVTLYQWYVDGNPFTAREFVMTMGRATHTIVVA